MEHPQAVALLNALLDEHVTEQGDSNQTNCAFLRALQVARPSLPIWARDYHSWVLRKLSPIAYEQQKVSRKAMGEFLREWGEALADCVERAEAR